ncbi:hypothetical protein F4803DRAFT_545156 [Xylaria telfairii]|nr:hypothetical protein F4803DRAFT_545156 [Xylaria telfairii]
MHAPAIVARVVVKSAPPPPTQNVYLNQGGIEDRISEAVRFTENVFQQDPSAHVAFILDVTTSALVFPILQRSLEEKVSTGRSSPRTSTDATMQSGREGAGVQGHKTLNEPGETPEGPSDRPNNDVEYEISFVNSLSELDQLVGLGRSNRKEPRLLLITVNIQQLDGYHLGLRSLVIFEPFQKVSLDLSDFLQTLVTRNLLSTSEIEICYDLLEGCPAGPQQSLVRCVLDDEDPNASFHYDSDMTALLFLAIGFGVVSPLARRYMVVDDDTESTAEVFLRRLLARKAIIELGENSQKGLSPAGAEMNRRYQLGTGHARRVFQYMVEMQETDLNYAWLATTTRNLAGSYSDIMERDFDLALCRLSAFLHTAKRSSPILLVNAELDINTVMGAAANNLDGVLYDWERRGSVWYNVFLLDIVKRKNIPLNSTRSDFQPRPEISKGLFINAESLGHVKSMAKTLTRRLGIAGPLFNDSIDELTSTRLRGTYTLFVQAVVDAYPHNLVMLLSKSPEDPYACFAWDLTSHQIHGLNDQSFHRIRLQKVSGKYKRVLAVYLTLRSVSTEHHETYVEDLLVIPEQVIADLKTRPETDVHNLNFL